MRGFVGWLLNIWRYSILWVCCGELAVWIGVVFEEELRVSGG